MKDNPHRCVIDAVGNYVTFVLLQEDGMPYAYTLKTNERLIEVLPPGDILKPRWAGSEWTEMATPEEIEAAKPPESEPYIDPITEMQQATALRFAQTEMLLDFLLTETLPNIAGGI